MQGSLEQLINILRTADASKPWNTGGDTRTFQQYDPSTLLARRQLRPAWEAMQVDPVEGVRQFAPGNDRWQEQTRQETLDKVRQAMSDPMLVGAIKAYHGTPHTFPAEPGLPFGRFKKEAIGSGEGAAAYGHGASYSAEDIGVANAYQNALSRGNALQLEQIEKYFTPGNIVPSYAGKDKILEFIKGDNPYQWAVKVQAVDNAGNTLKGIDGRTRIHSTEPSRQDYYQVTGDNSKPGHLLELSHEWPDAAKELSNPLSKEHLLDWDKPLSEQSEGVKGIIKDAGFDWGDNKTGGHVYNWATRHNPDLAPELTGRAASEYLNSLGIPGIKYLDGSSRGAGQGSHNFVMFEPEYTKIMARDGIPVQGLLSE